MLPPPCCLLPQATDPTLERLRTRLGVAGLVLTAAYLAVLPYLVAQ